MPILGSIGSAAAKGFGMLGKVAAAVDEYFKYVTLLLHGNGTNGAQNNTFLDSSTNNFTITRNGNTTQGTFTPYGANWSNYFDGTGDYLNIASNNQFVASGVGFTVEAWVYYTSITNYSFVVASSTGANNYEPYWYIGSTNTGNWRVSWGNAVGVNTGISIALNTWHHVAISMSSSGSGTFYLNGVSRATSTGITLDTSATGVAIGHGGGSIAGLYLVTGYISNVRYVKNSSVYTANFTPPTTPLTAISGTALLTCQSNRFIDNSTNNFTITRNGDVSVQRFSPFSPTASYTAATIGGSGYWDGTGDALSLPASSNLALGTGNFTIEMWVNGANDGAIVGGSYRRLFSLGTGQTAGSIDVYNAAGTIYVSIWAGTGISFSGSSILNNAWNHFAITRSGTSLRVFGNGTLIVSATDSTDLFSASSNASFVGALNASAGNFLGYISDFRVLKGTALYTAAFTPPTAPLTAIANTQLLLNFTNGGIIDNAMMNDLETVGNAQISTSVSKFGGGSIYLDGTANTYLQLLPNSQNFNFGASGDYTIEGWVYQTNRKTDVVPIFQTAGSNVAGYIFGIDASTGGLVIYDGGATRIAATASTVPLNTWTHVAATRSGGTTRVFINGVQAGSATYTYSSTSFADPRIGINASYTPAIYQGYIDDFRITKGVARYTANFTLPVAPFADQ